MSTRFVPFLFSILVTVPAVARPTIDVIVMKNGDRLTCEIKKLDRGVLYVALDYVDGTVSIDWSKVERLESKQLFRVETDSGYRYTGSLRMLESPADHPRSIEILEDQQKVAGVIEQTKVVVADQFGESFWSRVHGTFSTGLMYSKANNATQYNLASDWIYQQERSTGEVAYSSALSNATGSTTSIRNQLDLTGRRLMRWNQWFYAADVSFLQSSEQGITLQGIYGGGIGRYLKNTSSARIIVTGGVAFNNTRYSDRPTEKSLVGLIAGNLYLYRFKKTNLTVTPVLLPYITEPGRMRFNLNAQYNVQIVKDFWWNLTLYGNWDNRVPVGLAGSDYGTSLGITYSFH